MTEHIDELDASEEDLRQLVAILYEEERVKAVNAARRIFDAHQLNGSEYDTACV